MSTKRDAIMRAALILFAQRGYDGVGLREIASEAGVAQPTINYHFESKINLLEAVVERGAERTVIARQDRLARLMAKTSDVQLEDIVRVLFQPYNQAGQISLEEQTFHRFVGKLGASENVNAKRIIMQAYDKMAVHFVEAMMQTPERFSRQTAARAYLCSLPTGMFAASHAHRFSKLVGEEADLQEPAYDFDDIITFICAGMRRMNV